MKYLNLFLPKETLLDITIVLISISFIEIGSLCSWNVCCSISKIYPFKNLYIFEIYNYSFFSYASGSNLESSKKLLTLQEMKFFHLMLQKLLFCFWEKKKGFLISSCIRFFRCFYYWFHYYYYYYYYYLFTSQFLLCLPGTLFLCCYRECYGYARAFFDLRRFLPYTPSDIWHNLLSSRFHWGRKFSFECCRASHRGSNHRPGPSVCLNDTVFSKCYYLMGSTYLLEAATYYYINYLSLVLNSLY